MPKAKDITGRRFGRLVAIKPTDKRATDKSVIWILKCDCGNVHETSSTCLLGGNTKSCGCYAAEQTSERFFKDLTGRRFGKLMAVKDTGKRYRKSVIWECKCDCGNVCEVYSGNLLSNHTKSCGCIVKELAAENLSIMQKAEIKEKAKKSNGEIDGTRATLLTSGMRKDNKSGVKGVCFSNTEQKWVAQISFKKRHYNLGRYKSKNDAIKIRKQAEEMLHEPFLEWYNENFKKESKGIVSPLSAIKEAVEAALGSYSETGGGVING